MSKKDAQKKNKENFQDKHIWHEQLQEVKEWKDSQIK